MKFSIFINCIILLTVSCDFSSMVKKDKINIGDGEKSLERVYFSSEKNEGLDYDLNFTFQEGKYILYAEDRFFSPDITFHPSFAIVGDYEKILINGDEYNDDFSVSLIYPVSVIIQTMEGNEYYTLIFSPESSISINRFAFLQTENVMLDRDYEATITGDNINIYLPFQLYDTVKSSLVPYITGVFSTIVPHPQAINFTTPISFFLKGENPLSPERIYTVNVIGEKNSDCSIRSFVFEVVNNPELTEDIVGIVDKNTISVSLPYNIMENNTPLEPTILLSSGASVIPFGSMSFRNPITFTVTGEDEISQKNYTVISTIDSDTLLYLNVSSPFVVEEGFEVAIDNYSIIYDEEVITLSLPPGKFLDVSGKRVGFHILDIPYNAILHSGVYGEVAPYPLKISSKDGNSSREYYIELRRATVDSTEIISISATCQMVYNYTIKYYSNIADYPGWTNQLLSIGPYGNQPYNEYRWKDLKRFRYWDYDFFVGGRKRAVLANDNNRQYNNFLSKFRVANPFTGYDLSNNFTINISNNFSNHVVFEKPADIHSATTNTSYVFVIMLFDDQKTYAYATDSFTLSKWQSKIYNPTDIYKFNSITVNGPQFCSFENIFLNNSSKNYCISGSDLIINMTDTANNRLTGIIATFDIVAETGKRETHTLSFQ